jgi:signal transduction histidine kinase
VRPTAHLIDHHGGRSSRLALLIGSIITVLLVAFTVSVVTSRDRARRLVDVATTALHADIARREGVERQLRGREAELVGFAGVIAHDLRSPLARITGYTDFLCAEIGAELDAEHRRFLERMAACEVEMATLIEDLLNYATAGNQALNTRAVDLNLVVQDVVSSRTDAVGARLAAITTGWLPTIDGDPTLLRQVFDNLIGNAIKYTPPDRVPRIQIDSRSDGDGRWRIEVTDNGIGIPEHQREAIFTAFTRADGSADYPGTGLGLAIVSRIVERHHGTIVARSGPDEGTTFLLTLPDQPLAALL